MIYLPGDMTFGMLPSIRKRGNGQEFTPNVHPSWPELAPVLDDSAIHHSPTHRRSSSASQDEQQDLVVSEGAPSRSSGESLSNEHKEIEGSRKRRQRIPPKARRLLEASFNNHRENPYIPQQEIDGLVTRTGLTLRQVRTFFANARARRLPHDTNRKVTEDMQSCQQEVENAQQIALGNRVNPVAMTSSGAIVQAAEVVSNTVRSDHQLLSSKDDLSNPTAIPRVRETDPSDHLGARRGRRRKPQVPELAPAIIRKPSDAARKFQCTFCTLDFIQKCDWRRHEESVHFPQSIWTCIPDGPIENSMCAFCDERSPDVAHLETHKSIACSKTPRVERGFLRKDKLFQHIKQVHGCGPPKGIKNWRRPVERNITMACGICVCVLHDWEARVDHIAAHFKDGVGMDMWLLDQLGGIIPSGSLPDVLSSTVDQNGPISCDECPNRFDTITSVIRHRRQAHSIYQVDDAVAFRPPPKPGAEQPTTHAAIRDWPRSHAGGLPLIPDLLSAPSDKPNERAQYNIVNTVDTTTSQALQEPSPEHSSARILLDKWPQGQLAGYPFLPNILQPRSEDPISTTQDSSLNTSYTTTFRPTPTLGHVGGLPFLPNLLSEPPGQPNPREQEVAVAPRETTPPATAPRLPTRVDVCPYADDSAQQHAGPDTSISTLSGGAQISTHPRGPGPNRITTNSTANSNPAPAVHNDSGDAEHRLSPFDVTHATTWTPLPFGTSRESIRSMVQRIRRNGLGTPDARPHWLLHSLEQHSDSGAPWPSPYD